MCELGAMLLSMCSQASDALLLNRLLTQMKDSSLFKLSKKANNMSAVQQKLPPLKGQVVDLPKKRTFKLAFQLHLCCTRCSKHCVHAI